jgi:ComF family protein
MSSALQSLTDTLLGILFPDRCAGCGRTGSLLCETCRTRIRPYPGTGRALALPADGSKLLLDQVAIAFVFDGALRAAIHRLKYDRVRRMVEPLGELLAQHMRAHPLPADALVPVPLHPRRLAERGFNQSELLAQHLSLQRGVPLLASGLARSRDTAHQVGLHINERRKNVHEAFVWQQPARPPARVLLIDDVLTTGATLVACAHALRLAGAREVRALVLARSQPDRPAA